MRGIHLLHRRPPPRVIANEVPGSEEVLIFTKAMTLRHTIPEIMGEGAMSTSMMLTKGMNVISKAGAAHIMEESMLQIAVAAVVDNVVPTRKWGSLEVTSVTTSAPI
jgi:hypothetical protein